MKIIPALLLCIFLRAFGAAVGPLNLYTEFDPPYNFTNASGQPTGIFVDLVVEIQRRLGLKEPIQVVPWARAYHAIQVESNAILFSMARTPEREALFQWIGPVMENRWILFTRSDSPLSLASLEEARALRAIGTVRDFAWDRYLAGLGFTNLERVSENSLNLHKAMNGRIAAFVGADLSFPALARSSGYRVSDFKPLLQFRAIPLYIALSRASPPSVAEAWNRQLAALKAEGFLDLLRDRYLSP